MPEGIDFSKDKTVRGAIKKKDEDKKGLKSLRSKKPQEDPGPTRMGSFATMDKEKADKPWYDRISDSWNDLWGGDEAQAAEMRRRPDQEEQQDEAPATAEDFNEAASEIAAQTKSDKDFDKLLAEHKKSYENLSEQDKKWMDKQYKEYNQLRQDARNLYKQNQERMQWAEVAEIIAHAFVQLGAAHDGVATGRLNKIDWDRKYSQLLNDYRQELAFLKDTEESQERTHRMESKDRRASERDRLELLTRDHFASQRALDAEKAKILKGEKDAQKAAQKMAQLREKKNIEYEKVKGLISQMKEGDMDEDKALPKIRESLIKLGHTNEDFQSQLEAADKASWWGSDWQVLEEYVGKKQDRMNQTLGLGNPQAGPVQTQQQPGRRRVRSFKEAKK
jgi:hypothetical protein